MDESKKRNFFTHVFDFEDDSRKEMLNIAQDSVLAAVFVVFLNKAFELYMLLQVILMFLGLVFIHRTIEYVPTFSGAKYGSYNMIPVILPALMILLSLNSGVGRKVSMIMDKLGGTPPPAKAKPPASPFSQLLPQGINTMANPMGQSSIPGPPAVPDPDYNNMFAGHAGDFEPVAANSMGPSIF